MATSKTFCRNNNKNNLISSENSLFFVHSPKKQILFPSQIQNNQLLNHIYKFTPQKYTVKSNSKNKQNYNNSKNKQSLIKQSSRQKNTHKNKFKLNDIVFYELLNEIRLVVSDMINFNKKKLTFLDYLEILIQLKIIPSNYQPSAESDKVILFWNFLTIQETSANLINLTILLLAVMNMNININIIVQYYAQIPSLELKKNFNTKKRATLPKNSFNKTSEGYFLLQQADIDYFFIQFHQFRENRLKVIDYQVHQKSQVKNLYGHNDEISFKAKYLSKIKKQKYLRSLQSQYNNQQNCNFEICSVKKKLNILRPIKSENNIQIKMKSGIINNECKVIKINLQQSEDFSKQNCLSYDYSPMNSRIKIIHSHFDMEQYKKLKKQSLQQISQQSIQNELSLSLYKQT